MSYSKTIRANLGVSGLATGRVGVTIRSTLDDSVLRARSAAVVNKLNADNSASAVYTHAVTVDEAWGNEFDAEWDIDGVIYGAETFPIFAAEEGDPPESGTDRVAVDHDYGGTDALQIVEPGTDDGVEDALITAFEVDAYPSTISGQTRTGSDGRWLAPLYLEAGQYVVVVSKPGRPSVRLGVGSPAVLVVT